jgi:hypothetical protein
MNALADMALPSIEALFGGSAETGKQLVFEWRLIRRAGRPFLLVPSAGTSARTSLKLYSAQRWQARVGRAVFPMLLHLPGAHMCDEIRVNISTASPMIQFLARQSGVPVGALKTPAIKFGGLGDHKMRLVLLLSDGLGRPLKVVKAGLDEEGRATTRREADFLEQLPAETPSCCRLSGRLETPEISAFATDYFPGESPANDTGLENLFYAWLNPGSLVPVATLDCWRGLKRVAEHDRPLEAALEVLQAAMAEVRIHSTLHHGDFAPWNVRVLNSQNIKPYDWERGVRHGIPAWDWFHFIIQTAILVQRLPVERAAGEVEQLLASTRFKKFADTAGISEIIRPLMLGYLLNQIYVVKPLEGRHRTAELYDLLSMRWNLRPAPEQLPHENLRRVGAGRQLHTAAALLVNAFWEPRLNSKLQPPLKNQFARHWPLFLLGLLWLAGVGIDTHRPADVVAAVLPGTLLHVDVVRKPPPGHAAGHARGYHWAGDQFCRGSGLQPLEHRLVEHIDAIHHAADQHPAG